MKNQDELAPQISPVCPHCGLDPARYRSADLLMGNLQFVVIFCGNNECRKTMAVELVAMKPSQPSVIRPGILMPS